MVYALDEPTSAEMMSLARGAREQGWWTQYEDIRSDPYIGLEVAAASITAYSMYYIPALLQTEAYATALIQAVAPQIDHEIFQQRIEIRLRRQQLLDQGSRPHYGVLIDEAVLHRRVGGLGVMASQLGKIIDAVDRGQVTIQVIPFEVGAHAAQDSNFVLLEFDNEPGLSPVVFVEGLTGNQYVERDADVARYRDAIERLRGSGLNPHDSVQRVDELRKTFSRE
jgi:hypothetical protein